MNEPCSVHRADAGSNSDLPQLYRTMRRIRTFEERVGELFVRGQSAGSMLHLSIGEESAAAGVSAPITAPTEKITDRVSPRMLMKLASTAD